MADAGNYVLDSPGTDSAGDREEEEQVDALTIGLSSCIGIRANSKSPPPGNDLDFLNGRYLSIYFLFYVIVFFCACVQYLRIPFRSFDCI
ncbi:unnamed protein product [Protopolystoma xenopodis]|uniref:Uncharacterized protein n=1 Tax=Protopolystoma xenopodis TaxID=117903 RepID=A0A448X9Q2_9PLAT|nr:unnamed protein product [Protopolystoma xenopodis]